MMDQVNGVMSTEDGVWLSYDQNRPEVLAQMNLMASAISWLVSEHTALTFGG